jgi:hypothetical protein
MTWQPDTLFGYATKRDYGTQAEKPCTKNLLSLDEQYEHWKKLPGARHVLRHFYAITSAYVSQWQKTGVQVSAMLIWELVRHIVKTRINRAERRDIQLSKWGGYSLPNNFRARVARDCMKNRPDWFGIFDCKNDAIISNETLDS